MDRFTPTALLMAAIIAGGVWLAQAHAVVAAQVERIDIRTAASVTHIDQKMQRVDEDHDRLMRIEAQLEYIGKLVLIQINDQRAAKGEPLVPDEFPR